MNLTIESHPGGKAFVVKGDSRPYKDILISNHGKWNPSLGGYVFSNKNLDIIRVIVEQINSGYLNTSNTVPVYNTKKSTIVIPNIGSSVESLVPTNKMKTLTYTVYSPNVNDTVIVDLKSNKISSKVSYVNNAGDIFQVIPQYDTTKVYEIGVYSGKWQIRGLMDEHSIIFD